jgi:hypothetical protein
MLRKLAIAEDTRIGTCRQSARFRSGTRFAGRIPRKEEQLANISCRALSREVATQEITSG